VYAHKSESSPHPSLPVSFSPSDLMEACSSSGGGEFFGSGLKIDQALTVPCDVHLSPLQARRAVRADLIQLMWGGGEGREGRREEVRAKGAIGCAHQGRGKMGEGLA